MYNSSPTKTEIMYKIFRLHCCKNKCITEKLSICQCSYNLKGMAVCVNNVDLALGTNQQ